MSAINQELKKWTTAQEAFKALFKDGNTGAHIDAALMAAGTYRLKTSEYADALSLHRADKPAAYIALEIIHNRKEGKY
jgi:hypothetical protein